MAHKDLTVKLQLAKSYGKIGKPVNKRDLELYPDPNGNRKQRLAYRKKMRNDS